MAPQVISEERVFGEVPSNSTLATWGRGTRSLTKSSGTSPEAHLLRPTLARSLDSGRAGIGFYRSIVWTSTRT